MGEAMAKTTAAMGTMNSQMNVTNMQKMMGAYEAETAKMEMKTEASITVIIICLDP